jgi:hypothetical protein
MQIGGDGRSRLTLLWRAMSMVAAINFIALVSAVGYYSWRIDALSLQIQRLEQELGKSVVRPISYDLELNCRQQPLAPVRSSANRVRVLLIDGKPLLELNDYWDRVDSSRAAARYRCELVNRGDLSVHNSYIEFEYVVRRAVFIGESIRSGDIVTSHRRGFYFNEALVAGDPPRVFWVGNEMDTFVTAEFRERVLASTIDGRPAVLPLRRTGETTLSMPPSRW